MPNNMEVSTYLTPLTNRHETFRSLGIGSVKVPSHKPPGSKDPCDGSDDFVSPFSLTGYDLIRKMANVLVRCRGCKQPLSTTVSLSI